MPPTGRTKKEVVSEFRRSEIMQAARKIFGKKGFSKTTMDEIAEAAGLAKGTLYLYFNSKQDVYLKTLQRGQAELLERVKSNMKTAESLRAKIRSLIETRVKHAEENRDFYRIYLTEFGNIIHATSINRDFRNLNLAKAQVLARAIREGVERDEIRQLDVEAAAFAIHDMARSLIARRLMGWTKTAIEEDIDFLCDFIWMGIGR